MEGEKFAKYLISASYEIDLKRTFVWRPLEYGPERAQATRPVHDFDFVADDFNDLATQLGC